MIDLDLDRRQALWDRETWHIACLVCGWIPVPPEGLLIDRMGRLVEHLAEAHPVYLDFLRIVVRARERTGAA